MSLLLYEQAVRRWRRAFRQERPQRVNTEAAYFVGALVVMVPTKMFMTVCIARESSGVVNNEAFNTSVRGVFISNTSLL